MFQPSAFTREEWASLRHRTDAEGMSAANAVLGSDRSWAYLRDIDAWDDPSAPEAPELPPAVHALLADTTLPSWITDLEDLQGAMRRSCDLFQEYATEFILALLCKSLPECYAAGRGADVLTYTGQLGGPVRTSPGADDPMVRRVMETAVFVRHVMSYEYWHDTRIAVRTVQKIRMFHCGIRVMIHGRARSGDRPWDVSELGEPINQMDMAGTLLTFSLLACRGARALGVDLTEAQEREFIAHWIVIGHHLGIEEKVLRKIWERPGDVWDDIAGLEFGLTPTASGRTLVEALKQFIEAHVFTDVRYLHVSSLLMEDLMDERAQIVVLPTTTTRKTANAVGHVLAETLRAVHKLLLAMPFTRRSTIRRIGRTLIDDTIARWAQGRTAAITIEHELQEYTHV